MCDGERARTAMLLIEETDGRLGLSKHRTRQGETDAVRRNRKEELSAPQGGHCIQTAGVADGVTHWLEKQSVSLRNTRGCSESSER